MLIYYENDYIYHYFFLILSFVELNLFKNDFIFQIYYIKFQLNFFNIYPFFNFKNQFFSQALAFFIKVIAIINNFLILFILLHLIYLLIIQFIY